MNNFLWLTSPPNTSSSAISVVEKSDTENATTSKHTQLNKKDLRHSNTNLVRNDDINNQFSVYHQNVRGLKGKISEFHISLPAETPHLIGLTEHHLREYELANTHIPKYKLGANYCRKNLKQGGVCIYVCESIKYSNINLLKHTKEQDIEIAAIQLFFLKKKKIIVICVCRATVVTSISF